MVGDLIVVLSWPKTSARLRELADGNDVDCSDTWTDEDVADARRMSAFDKREREEVDSASYRYRDLFQALGLRRRSPA